MDPVEVECRLGSLEEAVGNFAQALEWAGRVSLQAAEANIKQWVTDFVSLRLQHLVPEPCEHALSVPGGPYLEGTGIRCTEEVAHRIAPIPIASVREMLIQKVVEKARAEAVPRWTSPSLSRRLPPESVGCRERVS